MVITLDLRALDTQIEQLFVSAIASLEEAAKVSHAAAFQVEIKKLKKLQTEVRERLRNSDYGIPLNLAASAMGQSTSAAKTKAAKENRKKGGGWPKGKKRKPTSPART